METWFIIIVSLCISVLLKFAFTTLQSNKTTTHTVKKQLPPGPPSFPIIGNLLWLRNSISKLESVLRELKKRYGSIITMRIGPRTLIFVSSHSLAHRALIDNGVIFADRHDPPLISTILSRSQSTISSSAFGATWRLLRGNLSGIVDRERWRLHSGTQRWAFTVLVSRLLDADGEFVWPIDHFRFAILCFLARMCFGDKLNEEQIKVIESVQSRMILGFSRFNSLNYFPQRLSKIIFRRRWNEMIQLRDDLERVLIPIIRARIEAKRELRGLALNMTAYVDTLAQLQFPEEEENGRKLDELEIVSLCSEFLIGGTDTTSTALQWIMANLTKYQHVQGKLYEEIESVVGPPPHMSKQQLVAVDEDDLRKMLYLKAVVLEGLRRHPPGHFVLPHKVVEDADLDGYVIPKHAFLNFMVADMGLDRNVWKDPLKFMPERFMESKAFDITGSREIKMMPFGAGKRICPASSLALHQLEYFVANLIWYFEWSSVPGEVIDLSEKQEFTVVMKNPFRARISLAELN